MTASKILELKTVLPQCKIIWDGGTIEPKANSDSDRQAAEWVIKSGGRVGVVLDGTVVTFSDLAELPSRPFKITNLRITSAKLSEPGSEILENCRDILNLDLTSMNPNFNSSDLMRFKNCHKLRMLSLGGVRLNDGLKPVLKMFPDLSYLSMPGSGLTDAQLEELRAFPKLERLELQSNKTTEAAIRKFAQAMPQCKIDWDGGVIEPTASPDLIAAGKLHPHATLDVRTADGKFQRIAPDQPLPTGDFKLRGFLVTTEPKFPLDFVPGTLLPALQPLEHFVGISDNMMQLTWTDEDVIRMAAMPCAGQLEQFKTGFNLNAKTVAALRKMTSLLSVNGRAAQATDADILALLELPNLSMFGMTQLDLAKGITFQTSKAIAAKPLRFVTLDGTAITPQQAKMLAAMPKLEHFCTTRIDKAAAKELAGSKSLQFLILTGPEITDELIQQFQNTSQLTTLQLFGAKVTREGLASFAKALPKCKIELDGIVVVPSVSLDADRQAAEYVLSVGGTVRVNGVDLEIRAAANLPKEPFRLTSIMITGEDRVTDAGLACFKNCAHLTNLLLFGLKNVSDAGLAHFANNSKLEILGLVGPQWTDAGLAHFKDCKNLAMLDLNGLRVTDAGLAHFKDRKKLTALNLMSLNGETPVTDAGLAHFKDCKNLNRLNLLSLPEVSDAGLAPFKGCGELSGINLQGMPKVTDAGLANFKDCKNLDLLYLNGLRITDAGLAHFKNCKSLGNLAINSTDVGDAGLAYLKDCQHLVHVDLQKTKVTPAKIEELIKTRPNCKIQWDGGIIEPKKQP